MAERMKMICTGGPYGDASSSYVVQLDKEYTVQEFVKMVLDEKPGEWGNFEITTDFHYTYTNRKDICEYKRGKIIADFREEKTKTMVVSEVIAHGGWTNMNYFIKVE